MAKAITQRVYDRFEREFRYDWLYFDEEEIFMKILYPHVLYETVHRLWMGQIQNNLSNCDEMTQITGTKRVNWNYEVMSHRKTTNQKAATIKIEIYEWTMGFHFKTEVRIFHLKTKSYNFIAKARKKNHNSIRHLVLRLEQKRNNLWSYLIWKILYCTYLPFLFYRYVFGNLITRISMLKTSQLHSLKIVICYFQIRFPDWNKYGISITSVMQWLNVTTKKL